MDVDNQTTELQLSLPSAAVMELDVLDDSDSGDVSTLTQLTQNINTYLPPVLLVVGSLGNLTSLIVLSRLSHKVLSTCLYLAVLCVADLTVLYTRCGNPWLFGITGYDVSQSLMINYDIVCKALPFAFNFTFHLSKWLVVATAIEGVIAAGFPQRLYLY